MAHYRTSRFHRLFESKPLIPRHLKVMKLLCLESLHMFKLPIRYTVNLVVFFIDKKLPELPDRSSGVASLLLPLSTKDKGDKTREEIHKLLNGNSGDPADWRPTIQVNGKILEDGNMVHVDTTVNGA